MSFDPEKHVLINVHLDTHYTGTEENQYFYVDKDEWEKKNKLEQAKVLDNLLDGALDNYLETFSSIVTDQKEISRHGEEAIKF